MFTGIDGAFTKVIYASKDIQICVLNSLEVYGGLHGQKVVKNKPKMVARTFCRDIHHDYLWSYRIETDIIACVLICFKF